MAAPGLTCAAWCLVLYEMDFNTFAPLPLGDGPDEIRQVMSIFNSMVTDLYPRHAQLGEAKKLTFMDTFVAGAAHKLNNPLNNISTSCQIALAELEEGDLSFIKKMLNTIQQESVRAGDIVRALLECSKHQDVYLAPFKIHDVVHQVQRLVGGEVPPGVEIKTDLDENLLVNIDSPKMTEAFYNLVLNSIHALGENGGEIFISARADAEQKLAVIKFKDSGAGIDEIHIKKIFEPFFTTKTAKNSIGLGLAIADGIIQKHLGRITVHSEKNKGAEFTITLPLLQADKDSVALSANNHKVL